MFTSHQQSSIETGLELPLMESFYTIQGEGYHQGTASYFIRLGGCDVGCHWCDVKDSWDAGKHPIVSVEEMINKATEFVGRTAIITGGEPLMYNLTPLTQSLKLRGFKCHIETSGAYPVSGTWDWICLSPKKFKLPNQEVLAMANELKIVIFNKSDFEFAEQYASKVSSTCRLYLQPEWSKEDEVLPLIIEYVKNNPQWRISLQVHKYMNIP
jgi:7-carboxy-7-deazaguanine synthase